MEKEVSILHLEDESNDAELVREILKSSGMICKITHVQTRDEFEQALNKGAFDVILSDFQLPGYDGMAALKLVLNLTPDIPFVFVSGIMGEDAAIKGLTQGATDYVLKQKLSRLAPAIKRVLHEAQNNHERKLAEESLSQQHELNQKLLDALPHPAWLLTRERKIIAQNKVGKSFGAKIGDFCWEGIHQMKHIPAELCEKYNCSGTIDKDMHCYYCMADQMFAEQRPIQKDITIDDTSWNTWWVPLDKDTYLHYAIDLTERKKMEEALRESDEKHKNMIANISDVIAVVAEDKTVTYISPNVTKFFGWLPEDLLGSDCWSEVHPADKERIQNNFIAFQKKDNAVIYEEIRYKCKNERYKTIGLTAVNLLKDVTINGVLINYNDITERKQAEAKVINLSYILENSLNEIYIIDTESLKFLFVNKGALINLGFTHEEIVELSPVDVKPDFTKESFLSTAKPLLTGEKEMVVFETINKRKDGTIYPVEVHLQLSNYEGKKAFVAIILDIAKRKQNELELTLYRNHLEELVKERTEELNKVNADLQREIEKEKEFEMMLQHSLEKEKELNEMKTRFISTTSHEFKTPLTSVLLSADLIKRYSGKWSDEKKNEHLDKIKSSVAYLTKLLDDVLTLSRAETGKAAFKPEKIDLNKYCSDCIEDSRSLLKPNHELKFRYKSEEKEYYLDPKLIKFILNNLLSNAVKYSPNGGKIELSVTENKRIIKFEVSDEGIGIPVDEIGKIFDSFYRTRNVDDIAGTGLGLSIVKRAVEMHNGEIKVTSELKKGTTFLVKIPKAAEGE